MSSKTKILVIQSKELIYTAIFAVIAIILIILLVFMFLPDEKQGGSQGNNVPQTEATYTAGIYTTGITIGSSPASLQLVVDETNIKSIELINLSESVTTMYPLIEPALNEMAAQIIATGSTSSITYSEENQYTCAILLESINELLEKAYTKE